MMKIKEVIVVEGRDDERAIKNAVDAEVIITSGWGLNAKIIKRIKEAEARCGVIIFTDPDTAGERIREKLSVILKSPKHCFLPREEALAGDNVGIENATKESIIEALGKCRPELREYEETFTGADMTRHGLIGMSDSSRRRDILGKILGVGYGNGKQLLKRLNKYGVTREEFESAVVKMHDKLKEEQE